MIKKILLLILLSSALHANDNFSFLDLTKQRYSPYDFDPSKDISFEQLKILAEATRNSPSSYNEQPWNYIICIKKTDLKAYEDLFKCLGSKNQAWAKNAPVLILCSTNLTSNYKQKPNYYAEYDAGAASLSLSYIATSLGFQVHQMGSFNRKLAATSFNLPSNFKPMTIIALGYAQTENKTPKIRKPLNQVFFIGSLKNGME